MLVGGEVGLPVAGFAVRSFHRVEAVEELHGFPGQRRAQFSCGNHPSHRKRAHLYGGFNDAHQMPECFATLTLGPVDDAFEGFVEQLVRHVTEHQLAKQRHKRQSNEGSDVQQC